MSILVLVIVSKIKKKLNFANCIFCEINKSKDRTFTLLAKLGLRLVGLFCSLKSSLALKIKNNGTKSSFYGTKYWLLSLLTNCVAYNTRTSFGYQKKTFSPHPGPGVTHRTFSATAAIVAKTQCRMIHLN